MTRYVNIPKPFMGTVKERDRNLATHQWYPDGADGIRCMECECRYFGGVSFWPCGKEERIDVKVGSKAVDRAQRHTAVAVEYAADVRKAMREKEMSDGGE